MWGDPPRVAHARSSVSVSSIMTTQSQSQQPPKPPKYDDTQARATFALMRDEEMPDGLAARRKGAAIELIHALDAAIKGAGFEVTHPASTREFDGAQLSFNPSPHSNASIWIRANADGVNVSYADGEKGGTSDVGIEQPSLGYDNLLEKFVGTTPDPRAVVAPGAPHPAEDALTVVARAVRAACDLALKRMTPQSVAPNAVKPSPNGVAREGQKSQAH
jgi:hypothetical protein